MGEWISVNDRLPESGKEVQICYEYEGYTKKHKDVWPIELFGYEEQTEVIGNIHDNPELLEN